MHLIMRIMSIPISVAYALIGGNSLTFYCWKGDGRFQATFRWWGFWQPLAGTIESRMWPLYDDGWEIRRHGYSFHDASHRPEESHKSKDE